MLHIFLFILKVIGWILLLVLCLLLLAIVAALFTPLRYQIETSCKGKLSTLEAGINFRILFRLISGRVRYRDGNVDWNIRAAWIRMGSQTDAEDLEETIEEETGKKIEVREKTGDSEKPDVSEDLSESLSDSITESKSADRKAGKSKKRTKETPVEEQKKKSLTDKFAAIFEKIKYTFDKICAKIKMLLEKAESVKVFLTDDVHQSAFLKCLTELKKMLIRLRPKRITGEVHFGFEDPSWTGRVLGGISMFYPYWGEHVCCYPDFENKVLDGELSVEGSLRLLPAAVLAWNLLWNKHVRRTVMDAKRFIFK